MKKIVIVGAGRVGTALATLLGMTGEYEVHLIDSDSGALSTTGRSGGMHLCTSDHELETKICELMPYVVVCCTPFQMNIKIAEICANLECHYVDFTEDVRVTKAITAMGPTKSTFVLQTGLAPGLVTCVGKSLLKALEEQGLTPTALSMRVGALPLVATLPAAYALTWSSAGLINEYMQPVERIVDGELVVDTPLSDYEELIVNGERLEAFNTSGGLGNASMYEGLQTVDYKTIRYQGHLTTLKKLVIDPLMEHDGDWLSKGIELAEQLFPCTRDDVVYMVVRARAGSFEKVFQRKFYGSDGLTALELTTAGTGAAVIECLDQLDQGIVFGGDVPLELLEATTIGSAFLAP